MTYRFALLPGIEPGSVAESASGAPGAEAATDGNQRGTGEAGDRVRTGDIQLGKISVSDAEAAEPLIPVVSKTETTADPVHGGPDRDR